MGWVLYNLSMNPELAAQPPAVHLVFIELGIVIIGLALLARFANRLRLSAIPLYLLAGLAFGNGGILPLRFSEGFVHLGAEIGAVLLLFMLGLEYTGEELARELRGGLLGGLLDLALNFLPGFGAGLLFGWNWLAALLLGGITYISSSGIVAKMLSDQKLMSNPEVPGVLSLLVLEDMAMAVFLPLVAALLIGGGVLRGAVSIGVALLVVAGVFTVAVRYGATISRVIIQQTDEIILLAIFGIVLLVAGLAQAVNVSAAIGAFLVGVAISGPVVEKAHRLMGPLRDLFAATFFLFFGLQIDPAALPPVLLPALALGLLTALTKLLTGWLNGRRAGLDTAARLRAGLVLIPRGEFSILIAALGAGLESRLGPVSAAYVLFLAVAGPIVFIAAQPLLRQIRK